MALLIQMFNMVDEKTIMEKISTNKTLVVDLDGTLIYGDLLFEAAILFIKRNPLKFFLLFVWLCKGKLELKSQLANRIMPNVETLPYNLELLEILKKEKNNGSRLILATASHMKWAKEISEHLGLFEKVIATDQTNMSGSNKASALNELLADNEYEYFGNASVDLALWKVASAAHVINASVSLKNQAEKLSNVKTFMAKRSAFRMFIKACRLHQWLKNALIFVPLLASHQIFQVNLVVSAVIAFFAFGLCASSVYLLNDLLDFEDDRKHKTKRFRPIASAGISIPLAVATIPLLLAVAFTIAFTFLPFNFVLVLIGYYILTVLYSFGLKKVVMLDVIILALLYTVRVIAGAAATGLEATFWILAFSLFIFLSLAFVKRYTELLDKRNNGKNDKTPGRGYYPVDFELLASLGGSSGFISVLVLALYINDAASSGLYQSAEIMWLACPLLLYWLSRTWLLAHRGEMVDDPVVYAVKDRTSQIVGVLFLIVFTSAALL